MKYRSVIRPSLILNKRIKANVTEDICRQMEGKPGNLWLLAFGGAMLLFTYGGYCLLATWWEGIGMWGENKTINWAWDITNFVWWIGIGHAGTLISAILLLFRSKWRNSINRSAEAMTLCAVTCSALFIIAHLGRPWVVYWILPIPNDFGSVWPNFNSALVWDAFAVSVYLIISLVFWYLGCLPDFATIKERSSGLRRIIYGALSMDWKGGARQWRRYNQVMLALAGLATALVVSVHSVVSMDFATGIIPGWHSTIFPPYFVAGAILSGFVMVVTLMVIMRKVMSLENYITVNHLEFMNKIIIANSGILIISYFAEIFMAWYSMNPYEQYMMYNRIMGPYQPAYITIMICNVIAPQLLWIRGIRRSIIASFILSIVINIGMWVERFIIVVTSLHRDFLPSSWAMFYPTQYDIGVFIFAIGLFSIMFLLFARFIPVINMAEVKELVKENEKVPFNVEGLIITEKIVEEAEA